VLRDPTWPAPPQLDAFVNILATSGAMIR